MELVALLPLCALLCAALWQAVLAGHAAWAAGAAARAAARAQAVGADPAAAARRALPQALERRLRVVTEDDGAVRVVVRVPSVAGRVLGLGSVSSSARFAPQGG